MKCPKCGKDDAKPEEKKICPLISRVILVNDHDKILEQTQRTSGIIQADCLKEKCALWQIVNLTIDPKTTIGRCGLIHEK